MKIHEYQGKELLRQFGVIVPKGIPVFSVEEAVSAAQKLGGPVWVVKAQIHAGGQGRDNVREYLREHPAMAIDIENRVREKLGVVPRTPAVGTAPAAATKASASKATKLAAAEPDSEDDI